jgi:hypothetical protein
MHEESVKPGIVEHIKYAPTQFQGVTLVCGILHCSERFMSVAR